MDYCYNSNILTRQELDVLYAMLNKRELGSLDLEAQPFKNTFDAFLESSGILVANGTVAIEAALMALGVRPGDEVIIPVFTWMATAAAVEKVGAIPILADVEEGGLCICAHSVEKLLTKRTRAIIPVHIYNRVANTFAFMDIAKEYNLVVIEDCAHGHGARINGRHVGSMADAGTFSFQGSKTLSCGEGGYVCARNPLHYEFIKSYVNCGRGTSNEEAHIIPQNYRMTNVQALILEARMENFRRLNALRQKEMSELDALLLSAEKIQIAKASVLTETNPCYKYVFFVYNPAGRDALLQRLKSRGIPAEKPYDLLTQTALVPKHRRRQWVSEEGQARENSMRAITIAHEYFQRHGQAAHLAEIIFEETSKMKIL